MNAKQFAGRVVDRSKIVKKMYCAYCGGLLSDGCSCEEECLRELAEQEEGLIEEYENRPETQLGWVFDDLMDTSPLKPWNQ